MQSGGRRVAFDVLLRVLRGGAWSGVTLDSALKERPDLDRRERALVTELVYGTLRWAPSLDAILAMHSTRPIESLDDRVLILLRLGAYQLMHMRVPDHAAVKETVSLAKEAGPAGATGFINGVLRALARTGPVTAPTLEEDPERHLLLREALPSWLFRQWSARLSLEETVSLARASNMAARVNLRAASVSHREQSIERLEAMGMEARRTRLSPVGIVLGQGVHPEHIEGWDRLRLQAQDEGAQLVTLYALLPSTGAQRVGAVGPRRVLDACAAPGGKTCHLAQAWPEATVVALDLHRRRAERVEREAARLGLSERIEVHAADATRPLPFADDESFDLVLVDAPCTGLGTLRRHPEIKLSRSEDDAVRLADLQLTLLLSLSRYVAPGGRLVYAVCTSTRAEGPGVVERFLSESEGLKVDPPVVSDSERPPRPCREERTSRASNAKPGESAGARGASEERRGASPAEHRTAPPIRSSGAARPPRGDQGIDAASVPWESLVAQDGSLELWTHRHGTDGFFAARFRKVTPDAR